MIFSSVTYILCFPSHWYQRNWMSQGQSSKENPSRHLFKRHGQATRGTVFISKAANRGNLKRTRQKIAELKIMMEKYIANTPQPLTDQQGVSQGHSSHVITNAGKSRQADPSNSSSLEHSIAETDKISLDHNPNTPLPNGLSSWLTNVLFPMFHGLVLREWIYRCKQFFSLDSIPPELKVRLAILHMTCKSLQWNHAYIAIRDNIFSLGRNMLLLYQHVLENSTTIPCLN